ncbi:MAG: PQQ-dependent sugar dehydrogenase [Balneolaceae bacterium]
MKTLQTILFLVFSLILASFTTGCGQNVDPDANNNSNSSAYFPLPESEGEVHISEEIDFQVQTVVEGLEVPWGMAFLPDGSVLISERDGDLRIVRDGELQESPIDGVPEVWANGQGGLLDVTLHPEYEDNGWIYISYSKPGDGGAHTAIIRGKLNDNNLTDIEELFAGEPPTDRGQHFGSRIVFDPDGYMYFSIGDRGQMDLAQDINSSNGKVYRLHDDGSIPNDNPFVGQDGKDEAFNYGHRNPQGMAVHPETGAVWTHEHGPRGGDEINIEQPGANYGWPVISYGINYDGSVLTDETEREGMEQPVHYWDPSIAPSGMAFISGDTYPAWEGNIMVGALSFQLLSRVVLDGDEFVQEERLLEGIGRIRDVELAPDGYIYFSNESDGTIHRIIPVDSE